MKSSTMTRGSLVVVSLQGRLASVQDPGTIPDELKSAIRRGNGIILNMADVPAIDCSGIGLLVTLYRAVRGAGGRLQLLNLQERPREMLAACGVLAILEPSDSEEDALASLIGPDRCELYLERTRLLLGCHQRMAFAGTA
jgi:anti-anti-sigma factor